MAFVQPSDVAVGDPTEASNQNAQNDAIADLNARVSLTFGQGVANGSFEFDFDSDGEPDQWTITDFSGGSHELDTTEKLDGGQSLKCVTTSGGGFVEALSDDFIPVPPKVLISVPFGIKVSTATVRVRVQLLYYNASETLVGSSTVYDSTANPTDWEYKNYADRIPFGASVSTAKYYKVKLIAGESGGSVAANVFFDSVSSKKVSGSVFANDIQVANALPDTIANYSVDAATDGGLISQAVNADVTLVNPIDGVTGFTLYSWFNGAWEAVLSVGYSSGDPTSYTVSFFVNQQNEFRIITSGTTGNPDRIRVFLREIKV